MTSITFCGRHLRRRRTRFNEWNLWAWIVFHTVTSDPDTAFALLKFGFQLRVFDVTDVHQHSNWTVLWSFGASRMTSFFCSLVCSFAMTATFQTSHHAWEKFNDPTSWIPSPQCDLPEPLIESLPNALSGRFLSFYDACVLCLLDFVGPAFDFSVPERTLRRL